MISTRDEFTMARVARITMQETEEGEYELESGEKKKFPVAPEALREVKLVTEGDVPELPPPEAGRAAYHFINLDSFDAMRMVRRPGVRLAVHNFANARNPGGGFLVGAPAQEEALCRQSTLYASLTAADAEEYYAVGMADKTDTESCVMLYSPNVLVFRDGYLEALEEPVMTSVFTLAAPDCGGRAMDQPEEEVRQAIKRRLALMLDYAAAQGISGLVLGAWGCGAFHNDPEVVAAVTRELLVDEGREKRFSDIAFGILGPSDSPNMRAFRTAFADRVDDRSVDTTVRRKALGRW